MIEHADQFISEFMELVEFLDMPPRRIGNIVVERINSDEEGGAYHTLKLKVLYGRPFADGYSYDCTVTMEAMAKKLVAQEIFEKLCLLIKPYEHSIQMGEFVAI